MLKDWIIYLNGQAVYRIWAKTAKTAKSRFLEQHGPWHKRPGYTINVREFGK